MFWNWSHFFWHQIWLLAILEFPAPASSGSGKQQQQLNPELRNRGERREEHPAGYDEYGGEQSGGVTREERGERREMRPPGSEGERGEDGWGFSLPAPVWVSLLTDSLCSMFGPMYLCCSLLFIISSVFSLKCFSDPAGLETSLCEEKRGYRTCFIKYNHSKSGLRIRSHLVTFLSQGARSRAEAAPPRTSCSSRSARTTWWWGRAWGPGVRVGRGSATVGLSSVTTSPVSQPPPGPSSSWPLYTFSTYSLSISGNKSLRIISSFTSQSCFVFCQTKTCRHMRCQNVIIHWIRQNFMYKLDRRFAGCLRLGKIVFANIFNRYR